MARGVFSTSNYLSGSTYYGTLPYTMFAWAFVPSGGLTTATDQHIFGNSNTGSSSTRDRMTIGLGQSTGDKAYIAAASSVIDNVVFTANTVTANAHNSVCGVFENSSSRRIVLNGDWANSTTATPTRNPTVNIWSIGAQRTSHVTRPAIDLHIAEVAQWSVALTQAEIETLHTGVCPLFVRPRSLVRYWPMHGRAANEEDWVDGQTATQTGSVSTQSHPRIIYPRRHIIVPVGAAAPTTFIPSWARQNSRVIGGGV